MSATVQPTYEEAQMAEHLTVESIDEMACTFPYLLGFVPEESLVVVFTGDAGVILTARLDLADATREAMAKLVAPALRAGASAAYVGVFSDAPLPVPELVDHLAGLIAVRDAMHLRGGRRTSYLCPGHCCDGVLIDPAVQAQVAAKWAATGVSPSGSRADLAAEVAPSSDRDGSAAEAVDGRLARPGRSREAARDELIGSITASLLADDLPGAVGPAAAAGMACALADVRVRDTVAWDVAAMSPARRRRAEVALRYLARQAPDGRAFPALTLAAVAAYLGGDGARARVALEAALGEDPDYPLALLVDLTLQAGLPPQDVAGLFTQVTREQCRTGMGSNDSEEG
jgi:hypothetical protein